MIKERKYFDEIEHNLRNGDVLLFQSNNWMSKCIQIAGRSQYSHAGMIGWWKGFPMLLESCALGCRASYLTNVVKNYKGKIDLYRMDPVKCHQRYGFDSLKSSENYSTVVLDTVVEKMISLTGKRYGWWGFLKVACLHLPIIRIFSKPNNNDDFESPEPPLCSPAISISFRDAGVDLVPNLADSMTEPGDLARSSLLTYQFTLK